MPKKLKDVSDFAFRASCLPVKTPSKVLVSDKLRGVYKTRDLLKSHSRRIHSASAKGRLPDDVAWVAEAVVKRQLESREKTAPPRSSKPDRPASAAAGMFHNSSTMTDAEREMNDIYLAKRREELNRRRNAQEVQNAVKEWQLARVRAEEDIMRRIESRRRPLSEAASGGVVVQRTVRDVFTPPPPVSASQASSSTEGGGKKKPRPKSAGAVSSSRRRLPVPVAVPSQPFMRFRSTRPQSAVLRRPPSMKASDPVGVGKVEASAARLRTLAWEPSGAGGAAAGRLPRSVPAAARSGGDGSADDDVDMSDRRRQQVDETKRIQEAFARAGMSVDPKVLRRALVMTDDKPKEVVTSTRAPPALGLPNHPLQAELDAIERRRKLLSKKKKKKKKKRLGA